MGQLLELMVKYKSASLTVGILLLIVPILYGLSEGYIWTPSFISKNWLSEWLAVGIWLNSLLGILFIWSGITKRKIQNDSNDI
ncbi:hypothetical protein [Maribellus mangrovi]|uniref:hypothetical protein n=1 Tax=Maribellus mangrovi TaxID=3133146 RepID=UPI0030EC098B